MLRRVSVALTATLVCLATATTMHAEIVPNALQGRFVQIDNTVPTADGTWFHIGEVGAVSLGTDRAFSGLGASATTTAGGGGHGADANLISGIANTGGGAWTRTDNPAGALIDLGSTQSLQSLFVHQRDDGCCQGRLSNFTISLLADNGGTPGATVFSGAKVGTVATNDSEEFTLAAGNTIRPGGSGVIGTEQVGNNARFVRVQNAGGDSRLLHIGEIEAFADGSPPNGGGGLSTNELVGESVHSTQGVGGHGPDGNLINDVVDGGVPAWTRDGINSYATIDLGSTLNVGTVRAWQRGDGCCQDRLSNFTVQLLTDDGGGNPGAVMASQSFPGQPPSSSFAQFTFPDDFTIGGSDILEIEIDLDAMVADLLSVGASGTGDLTIEPGATLNLLISGGKPMQTFDILDFGNVTGSFDNINITGPYSSEVILNDLLVNGQITVAPEPASIAIWSLLGLALGGFGYRRLRRK